MTSAVGLSPKYDGVTGQYVNEDAVQPPNEETLDDHAVERLWALSQEAVST